jgi:hypothetical protein
MFEYQFYCSFILVAMLDTVVAMPDVVVAIVTTKKLTEKGLPSILGLGELWQDYSLDVRIQVEIHIIELRSGVSNSFAVDC